MGVLDGAGSNQRPSRRMRQRGGFAFWPVALAIVLLAHAQWADALDSSRSLTQYLHRIWQVQQGLPQTTIYAIRQTSDGYLWLGTQSGLYRFDGVRFTTLDEAGAEALKEAWVRDLMEGPDQSLWVATHDAGLFRIKGGQVQRHTRESGLPSNRVYRVIVGREGQVWACTGDGVAQVAPRSGPVLQRQQGLSTNDVRAACVDARGALWVAGQGAQLDIWDGAAVRARMLTTVPATSAIRDVYNDKENTIWVATTAGLVRLRGESERRYTTADGLAGNEVFEVMQATDGTIWAGTEDGFSRVGGSGHIDSFRARDGLSQSTVYALFEDREGSLWVGTKHGLNQFLDGRIVPFTTNEGLPSNNAGPILQDSTGEIWVGSSDAGLCRIDARGLVTLTTRNGLASNNITALAEDADGMLWIGTDHGLSHYLPPPAGRVDRTYRAGDGLPSEFIRCVLKAKSGDTWVGTSAGAAVLSGGHWSVPRPADGAASGVIAALCETGEGMLAAREDAGLLLFRDGMGHDFSPRGDPLRDVAAFYRDRDGLLWLGMRGGGLGLFDGNRVVDFTVQDGLFDDDLRSIAADAQDRLWMACSKGLFSVNRGDLNRIAAGTEKKVVSLPFSPTEGLRTIECSAGVAPAAWVMRDGRIWFSTIRGVVVIDPARLQRNLPPPRVVVEQVLVDGKEREGAGALPPGVKNVTFRYTGLSFVLPTRITFRYQLEGFDKEWVDAGTRREAFYTNLPPGSYKFRVMAANSEGVSSEASSAVGLMLSPQIYQRGWFWPLCAVLLACVVTAAFRLRLRSVRRRMDAIVAERGRIARELHDTLVQGFSGVTMQLQALVGRMRGRSVETALGSDLQGIINDATLCLREARRSIAGLREPAARAELANLIAEAVRQQTDNKPVAVQLHLEACPRSLPAQVEFHLLRIVQEATANSVRHAAARTLAVGARGTEESLVLEIRDDGRGFAVEAAPGNGHFGIVGMRERATAIGAELQIESAPARGTVVRVTLPLHGGEKTENAGAAREEQSV